MAITTFADFTIYQDQFHGSVNEVLQQQVNVFNGASNGGLRLVTNAVLGEYGQESFFTEIANGGVSRRDLTSTAAVTPTTITHDEMISVKLNRKAGPFQFTEDAYKKIGMDPGVASVLLGEQVGQGIAAGYVNDAISAAVAALTQDNTYSAVGQPTETMNTSALTQGLQTMGDRNSRVVAWVMHSTPFFDLMRDQISGGVTNVADVAIYTAGIGSLNRPVIVTDSPSMVVSGSPDTYYTLGLTPGGVVIEESETRSMYNDLNLGGEQITQQIQGEHAFNLSIKGYKWDITNGGANPSAAAIATATNWDKVASDDKSLGGFTILTK